MGTTPYEVGQVADDARHHVLVASMRGPQAKCGAGAIVHRLAGRFDPDEPDACADCAAAISVAR